MKIQALKQEFETLDLMVREVLEKHPNARTGIIVMYDEGGAMQMLYHCTKQELALASVRLAQLATSER